MNRERPIQRKFYVDEIENEKIETKMHEMKLESFGAYARMMLIKGKVTIIDFETLKNLRYEINKIGVNVNQLVKLAHENQRVSDEDIETVLEQFKQLNRRITKIINDKIKDDD